jgi:hypothetical protein
LRSNRVRASGSILMLHPTRRNIMRLLPLAILLTTTVLAHAEATLLGVGSLPGNTKDLSGLKGKASDGTPNDTLGGHGSAIAITGTPGEYVLASDRGPKDGTVAFAARMHRMKIDVNPDVKPVVSLKLLSTTLLKDERSQQYDGLMTAGTLRLDVEGVRVARNGNIYVADEYGPVVFEFDGNGKKLRRLKVPEKFTIVKPGKIPADELPPKIKGGRQPNRGMECLAISPDGSKLYGLMQSPLIQDHGVNDRNERVGLNCRILEIDLKTEATREFVYQLDHASHGNSEIVAVNSTEFLVLERDRLGGKDAKAKKIFHIDLAGASDVSALEALPKAELPKDIKPVKKTLFLDLLDKKYGLQDADLPEKFEGLTFGPDLADGRRLLLVTADNDFVLTKPFRVYAFAIDKADLPKFEPQVFGK